MLKSKTAFKPKAKAVPRRNAPASASQTREASSTSASNTPAPAAPTPQASVDQGASQSLPSTTAVLTTIPSPETSSLSPAPTQDGEGSSLREQGEPTSSIGQVGGARQPDGTLPTENLDHSERPPPGNNKTSTTERSSIPQLPVSAASTSTVADPSVPKGDSQPTKASTPAPPQVTQPPPEPTSSSPTATPIIPSNPPSTRPAQSLPQSTSTSSVAASQTQPAQPVSSPIDVDSLNERQPTAETTPTEPATAEPSGASKSKRPRKRKAGNTTEDLPGQEGSSARPTKRPRAKRAAPLPGEEGYEPAAKPKRARKRKAPTNTEGATEDAETGSPVPSKRPRQREATPEDAETVQIDITQVKMADLAKDMHIGKKFSLHDKLLEQERLKRQKANEKKRQKKNGSGDEEGEPGGDAPVSKTNDSTEVTPAGDKADGTNGEPSGRTSGQLAPVGEQYQIVDGVIVVDARSLQVDRHARAAEEAGELEEQEENDFTHHVTSATYLRRNLKPQQWTEDETEQFYSALSSWGTDFETISKMFPNKTRKHVKLKFNREERANPKRINDALIGKKTAIMNIEDYQRLTGMQYETTEAIDAELKKNQEEFDAREKAVKEAQAEENRKKREALFGAPADDADDGEGGKKKRGRKKAKVSQAGLW